jgi:uncharacterized protein DUF3455
MNRTVLATALAFAAMPALAAISRPSVPPRLEATVAEEPAFVLSATGAQVFECRALANGGYGWVFTNPDATLSDGTTTVATHTEPNLWEASSDRSSVSAVVRSAAASGPDNLPWTLMSARSDSGSGLFAGVTSVQRLHTVGGVAPRDGCGEYSVGTETRVNFAADYYFYKPRGST